MNRLATSFRKQDQVGDSRLDPVYGRKLENCLNRGGLMSNRDEYFFDAMISICISQRQSPIPYLQRKLIISTELSLVKSEFLE